MPEIRVLQQQRENNIQVERKAYDARPPSACVNWLHLPYELWLDILVNYGVSARDLVNLEYTCKWFNCWGDGSVTEEAARLVLKRYSKKRYGELVNRVFGASWKEKLYILEGIESRRSTLAAGSYQNIVTKDGQVLTWGAGRFGQLGNQEWEDKCAAQNITKHIPPECGKAVQVSAGCGHSGFITENGEAYTCGDNRYCQLGQSDFLGKTCAVPKRVHRGLDSKRCLQIACGSSHSLFLTDTGELYVTGEGDSGQLGLQLRRRVHGVPEPTLVEFPYEDFNIVHITAGIAHNILLTECGKAFTFGLGSTGQLGHGGTKNIFKPTLVSVLMKHCIVHAAAGVTHSIFIDKKGYVYTCGKGNGLLGHGDTRIHTVPRRVKSLEEVHITKAAAGVANSIFISREGTGYWCGEGMGEHKNCVAELPTQMNLPEPLCSAAIGNSHVVLLLKSGHLMSLGTNGRFQTGHQTEGSINTYTYIN